MDWTLEKMLKSRHVIRIVQWSGGQKVGGQEEGREKDGWMTFWKILKIRLQMLFL